jgi:hypothetical protein
MWGHPEQAIASCAGCAADARGGARPQHLLHVLNLRLHRVQELHFLGDIVDKVNRSHFRIESGGDHEHTGEGV